MFIWFILILAIAIIIMSIVMAPDSNSFSGALVGSSDLELFKVSKERGTKKVIKQVMWWLGISLLLSCILIRAF